MPNEDLIKHAWRELFPTEPPWTDDQVAIRTMMGEVRFLRALLASILLQLGNGDAGLAQMAGDQMFHRSKIQ